jgi:hypothetical protein
VNKLPQPRKLADFGELTPAEARLIAECDSGEGVVIGEPYHEQDGESAWKSPVADTPEVRIRATLIRWLLLGGADGVTPHEKGVRIMGAWVAGILDLGGCRAPRGIMLVACHFEIAPVLRSAVIDSLVLDHSVLPGLRADRLETRGSVSLGGAMVRGETQLLGAKLGGALECVGARFERPGGVAFSADGIETRLGVSLQDAEVRGGARLLGAKLGDDLSCNGATFERPDAEAFNADRIETRGSVFLQGVNVCGRARLLGAKLGSDLVCADATFEGKGGEALSLEGIRVAGAFVLRGSARIHGVLKLTAAEIGLIADDRDCWPGHGDLLLERCRYGAIVAGPVDAPSRLDWLSRQDPARWGVDFWPQPYVELARVLREMGHDADARAVLIEKERLQRRTARGALRARLDGARLRLRMETATVASLALVRKAFDARHAGLGEKDPRRKLIDAEVRRARSLRGVDFDAIAANGESVPMSVADRPEATLAARAPIAGLWWRLLGRTLWDGLVGAVIGYGRRPERAGVWALALWLSGAGLFLWAYTHEGMQPSNALVLRSAEWTGCRGAAEGQSACYLATPQGASYPRFEPFVYSADVLLPVVELQQQALWSPAPQRGAGWWARGFQWFEILAGWALSLLAIAGFSGLVKSD